MRTIGRDLRTGSSASDADLVYAARSGNSQARETLFRRYVRFVHATTFRLAGRFAEPQPLVEETFRQVFASLDQLAHAEALRAWIAGIVVKVTHGAIRQRHLRTRFWLARRTPSAFDAYADSALSHEAAASVRALYDALDRMALRPRAIFLLRHMEGMSLPDIAVALETSVTDVKRALARTERRLGVVSARPEARVAGLA